MASPEYRLTSEDGQIDCLLPHTMVFLGRCNCDINIQWDCVDKRHALLTYNHYQNNFQVKDLGTSAGTFINGKRIPDQTFIAVDVGDTLQLGDQSALLKLRCPPPTDTRVSHGLPQSQSLDMIRRSSSCSSGSHSAEDIRSYSPYTLTRSNSQGSKSSGRPTWDRRPLLAECKGCIQEQELHHSCGINSELDSVEVGTVSAQSALSHSSPDGLGPRVSPVSPLHLVPDSKSPPQNTLTQHVTSVDNSHNKGYHIQYGGEKTTQQVSYTIRSNDKVEQLSAATKRGTPLYGQPTWWGESGADDHNKQLLKDMQRQKDQDKHTQKAIEEERSMYIPANQSNTDGGGTVSKNMAFVVDLDSSSEIKTPKSDPNIPSDKLSNFLPGNLRKSIHQRKERLLQLTEKNQTENNNSSLLKRSSKSPIRLSSHQATIKEVERREPSSSTSTNIYLINKMLYSSGETNNKSLLDINTELEDPQAEYALYSEAKFLNRSSTMPELKQSCGTPRLRSQPSDAAVKGDDDGDKVSESGTYTIEEDNKELEKAREDIDRLFGIVTSETGSPELEISESTDELIGVGSSMQVEIGSDNKMKTNCSADGISTKKEEILQSREEIIKPNIQTECHIQTKSPEHVNDVVISKPPISPIINSPTLSRRNSCSPVQRTGGGSNGRRLPATPRATKVKDSNSHSTSPLSLPAAATMPRRKKEVEFSKEKILQELGIGEAPVIEKERPKLVEELLTARTYHKDNDPIIVNKTSFFDKILMSTGGAPEQSKQLPQISAAVTPSSKERLSRVGGRSVDSVNTDVLLQSTEEFMKAIHSFSSQSESPKPPSGKSKPSLRQSSSGSIKKSAVDRLSSTSTSSKADEVGGEPATSRASQPTTPRATMPARRSQSDSKTASRPLNGAKRSQSMKDSDNGGSLESVNNIKNLSSSNGRVGPLSSSRPNRTFELRRARTESLENENSTARASGRSARSLDPSEVSLGAKIVQKSRENGALSGDSKGAPIRRLTKEASCSELSSDGGRYSMRVMSSTSKTSNGKSTTLGQSSGTKSTTESKKTSRPSTNSMISKAEREREAGKEREKAAWDRRRSYDPRKAVQEAKARKSDSRGGTPNTADEPTSSSSYRSRANSCGGVDAGIVSQAPTLSHNQTLETRHSADVLEHMESNSLKLDLEKGKDLEDNSHELEIAQLSHNLAKGLDILSKADAEQLNGTKEGVEPSPETEELIDSMFACQQQRSAFSSYRSAASVTPSDMAASPALSPVRKKLSSSQNLENGSPSTVDHSYNNLVLTSIQRLSAKLQMYTGSAVNRLREKCTDASNSPSPTEELHCDDMPANSTLANILKTLKQVEKNCKVMDKALFTTVPQSELSTVSNDEHEHYLAEIKRIRHEIAGFKPIESDDSKKSSSSSKSNSISKSTANKLRTAATSKTASVAYKQRSVYY